MNMISMQPPGVCLGTIWRGDDQLLDEGHIIPSSNIWLDSSHAIQRYSGARRRVRDDTESSVWWERVCLIEVQAWVKEGKLERRERRCRGQRFPPSLSEHSRPQCAFTLQGVDGSRIATFGVRLCTLNIRLCRTFR